MDPLTYDRLQETELFKEVQKTHQDKPVMWFDPEQNAAFMDKVDGHCIMLRNNLCIIHKELGSQAKPHGCRSFPFIITLTPGGVYVGVSFACPSIAENRGDPVQNLMPSFQSLLSVLDPEKITGEIVNIGKNLTTDWEGYLSIEQRIREHMHDDGVTGGLFTALEETALLYILNSGEETRHIPGSRIKEYFHSLPAPKLGQDDDCREFRHYMAAMLITFLESGNPGMVDETCRTILDGGQLESVTFQRILDIMPLREYQNRNLTGEQEKIIRDFIDQCIWRKQLINSRDILTGLFKIQMFPLMIAWYENMTALCENRAVSDDSNCRNALGIIDRGVLHGHCLHRLIPLYTDNFINQLANITR